MWQLLALFILQDLVNRCTQEVYDTDDPRLFWHAEEAEEEEAEEEEEDEEGGMECIHIHGG